MLSRRYPVRCTLRLQCMHGAHSVQARRHGARNAGDQPGKCLPLTLLSACVLLRSGKTVEEVWNAIHTAEKRNAERNGTSTPPLDQQQTVGSFLQSIGALGDFGDSGIPSLPSSFLPPAPELQVHSQLRPEAVLSLRIRVQPDTIPALQPFDAQVLDSP